MNNTEQLIERLVTSIETLTEKLSHALPQPLQAPDWSAAVAWRYRKRASGHGSLEPVQHIAKLALSDLKAFC
jgi:predicted AAA+ superfamily ATPase